MRGMTKGTHKSAGSKSGSKAGLESGTASVESFKTNEGPATTSGNSRPKAEKLGTIGTK